MEGNTICRQIDWDRDEERLAAWAEVSRGGYEDGSGREKRIGDEKMSPVSDHNKKQLAAWAEVYMGDGGQWEGGVREARRGAV